VVQACYDRAVGKEYLDLGAATTPTEGEDDTSTNPLMTQIKDRGTKIRGAFRVRSPQLRKDGDQKRDYLVPSRSSIPS
jgi:hypothetical protein